MKPKTGGKLFGFLFAVAMVLALASGMTMTARAATGSYGVWICGTEVTEANRSGTGWSYDPATSTLTLDGFSGTYTGADSTEQPAAVYAQHSLTIRLKGSNKVIHQLTKDPEESRFCHGIIAEGSLVITGNGTLTANGIFTDGSTAAGSGETYGLQITGSLTIDSGATVYAKGGIAKSSTGVRALSMTVKGTLEASAAGAGEDGGYGIQYRESLTVESGGTVTATAGGSVNSFGINHILGEQGAIGGLTVKGTLRASGNTGAFGDFENHVLSYTVPVGLFATESSNAEGKSETSVAVGARTSTGSRYVQIVSITGITLFKTSTTLTEGAKEVLQVGVYPASATSLAVEWSSSDSSVATVNEGGMVTAVKAGTATITAKCKDGSGKSASCVVTVVEPNSTATPAGKGQQDSGQKAPSIAQERITILKAPTRVKAKARKAKVTVSWKKLKKTKKNKKLYAQVRGYQVQCSTDPGFRKDVITKKVGKKKAKIVLKLQKKTIYYVRVRYFGEDGFSYWSKVKRVKTKK